MNKSTLWPFMNSITFFIAGSGLMTSWLLMKTLEPIHSQLALSTPIAVVDFGRRCCRWVLMPANKTSNPGCFRPISILKAKSSRFYRAGCPSGGGC